MFIFILGFLFLTVIQPTFYPSGSSSPPASGPTATPVPGGPTATPTIPAGVPTPTPTTPAASGAAFFTINTINPPGASVIQKGAVFTIEVVLNTGDFEIEAVDLFLNFDQKFLQAESVEKGTASFQYNAPEIDNGAGKITLKAYPESLSPIIGFQGEGQYATVTFKALQTTGPTQITFISDESSSAVSNGRERLDLAKCLPGNYQITN